jgi:hypothetical protein
MTPFEAYQMFQALKQHFTTKSYDYFKYHGKIKADANSFDVRKDKYFYYKLSKKEDLQGFLVANFITNNVKWVGDLLDNNSDQCYIDYSKRQQALTYLFRGDISALDDDFAKNFKVVDGQFPPALKLYNRKEISIETLVVLNEILGIFNHWNKEIVDPIVWPSIYLKCMKYKPFMSMDIAKLKQTLRDKYI